MKNDRLRILFVAAEMFPFAKVGGLADVIGSLSAELAGMGHDVRVVLPKYACVNLDGRRADAAVSPMGVWMGTQQEWCGACRTVTEAGVSVYLIDHQLYFAREGIYHSQDMRDYADNPRRFCFLCRAAMQVCIDTGFRPDVVHANDWQTAPVCAYLKVWHADHPLLGRAASLLTIHNIAYQGTYPKSHYEYLGLGWRSFTPDKFEAYGQINLLKGSIYFADMVTTVSPTYAREMSTPHGGCGLAPFVSNKGKSFVGILNGVDYNVWSPNIDPLIPAAYSPDDTAGKKVCKRRLQETFSLVNDDGVALIGAIGRFVQQKGFDLIAGAIEEILKNMRVQFVILGTGEQRLEEFFRTLPMRHPGRVGSFVGFSNEHAHLVEAGCDFLLMPSRFEPCGLNQMYSQRYGTLPIVRATGGLDDTVVNYDESTGDGTGFKFVEPSVRALYYTVGWAVSTYYDRPHHLREMIRRAMRREFSWRTSALAYEDAYARAIDNRQRGATGDRSSVIPRQGSARVGDQ